MLTEADLRGIYVPVVTPFSTDEELDMTSYQNYVERLLQHDIQGLVINGTTGEAPTVSWEEVAALVHMTKACMAGRANSLPLVIGAGTNHTLTTVKRIEHAGEMGADAVLVVTPYYSRPSEEGILEHYRRAAQVGVPVIAYEIPSRTGVRLSVDIVRKIMDFDGVIGLKDSTGGTGLFSEFIQFNPNIKPVLCGDDLSFLDMLKLGASGGMLASANVKTDAFIKVFQYACKGIFKNAEQTFDSLAPLIERLFQESNPSPLKWMLAQQGIINSDTLRLPMVSITEELKLQLRQCI
jgi:4-hydroxy-tetrahydrodipicolinate synthase